MACLRSLYYPLTLILSACLLHIGRSEVFPIGPEDMPRDSFPAATASSTNGAWPRLYQPRPLEAWPVNMQGNHGPCWKTSVVYDTNSGWPGKCTGLTQVSAMSTQDACRSTCELDVSCAVWRASNASQCYQGSAEHCEDGNGVPVEFGVRSAQQIQHGEVTVLKDMMGWEIQGLRQLDIGQPVGHSLDSTSAKNVCKNWCYTNIRCQYWQYASAGCWVEDPAGGYAVEYPLLAGSGAIQGSDFSKTMLGGEYIQHYCPVSQPTGSVSGTSAGGDAEYWWIIVAACLFIALACLALGFFMTSSGKRKDKSAKKRGLQMQAGHEQEVVSPDEVEAQTPLVAVNTPMMIVGPMADTSFGSAYRGSFNSASSSAPLMYY